MTYQDNQVGQIRRLRGRLVAFGLATPLAALGVVCLVQVLLPDLPALLGLLVSAGIGIAVCALLVWLMLRSFSVADLADRIHAREILANANEGILTVNKYGLVISLNAAAEKMFGYTSAEIRNAPLTKIIIERLATDSQRLFQDSLPVGTILGLAASAREVIGLHKSGETFAVELTVSSLMLEDGPIVVGFARDISKRKRAQRYLTAHYTATCVMAHAHNHTDAIAQIVQAVCQALRWEVGAFWRPQADNRTLACHTIYQDPAASLPQIFEVDRVSCGFEQGVIGRTWTTGKSQWLEDGLQAADCPWLNEEGPPVRAAIALPVVVSKRPYGVLVFYNRKSQRRDEQLADILNHLANQFGQFVARKRDEERLYRSEERFRQLAENIHDVFWMADARDNRLLYLSPSFEEVWGRSANDSRDRSAVVQHVHVEDRAAVQASLEKQKQGEETSLEYRVIRPDGSVRWVCDRAFPVLDANGRAYRIAGIAADITEQRRTREALRETTQTLQALVKSAPVAINIIDVEGKVRLWNPAAERIFGWKEAELLGQPLPEFGNGTSAGADGQSGPDSALGMPTRCRRKDGKEIETSLSTAPLRDSSGTLLGVMGIMMDLTEKKRLEEKLRQAQKMEAVGQLAGGIAHDFNNLLTIILGYNELLLMKAKPSDPMRDPLEQIRNAGQRAASLTSRLLAFGRKQTLQVQVLDLNAVIEDMAKIVGRVIGDDIEVLLRPAADLCRVKADPVQIEQILLNLATNARDAMPTGGLITIETANVEFDRSTAPHDIPDGCFALLSFSDTGNGMDEKTRVKIFEPFFTTKEIGKGTGLGLATVYGIVKQSGGHIEVESQPGSGTTFRIYLPSAQDGKDACKTAKSLSAIPTGKETVLLVEDEECVRKLIYDALNANGYNVLQAGSPQEALELCEKHKDKIALLVTDVIMPQMNGKQLAEKAVKSQDQLKVLFMSGYTDSALGKQSIIAAGIPFLQKPITMSKLGRKVREVLDAPMGTSIVM